MKIFITLAYLFVFHFAELKAQQPKERITFSNHNHNDPLVLVDTLTTDIKYMILDPKNIVSIEVIKNAPAMERFGERGQHGVVLIQPSKNINLLRLPALLEAFAFPVAQRNLRVSINEVIVRKPELLLADPAEIESIRTIVLPMEQGLRTKEETFINIKRKKKDQ